MMTTGKRANEAAYEQGIRRGGRTINRFHDQRKAHLPGGAQHYNERVKENEA